MAPVSCRARLDFWDLHKIRRRVLPVFPKLIGEIVGGPLALSEFLLRKQVIYENVHAWETPKDLFQSRLGPPTLTHYLPDNMTMMTRNSHRRTTSKTKPTHRLLRDFDICRDFVPVHGLVSLSVRRDQTHGSELVIGDQLASTVHIDSRGDLIDLLVVDLLWGE